MKRCAMLAVLAAAIGGCGGGSHVPPAADSGQILVSLEARKKEGIRDPREGTDAYSTGSGPEKGANYARVDYKKLGDIAVILSGAGLDDKGPAPRTARLAISDAGADHQVVLLAPNGLTTVTISNSRARPVSLFTVGDRDGFDVTVPSGGNVSVTLRNPGHYALSCAEDEDIHVLFVVAPSTWALTSVSGEEILFDKVPPGDYELTVVAPRLPPMTQRVKSEAGKRTEVDADVSVNALPKVK